jgi:hypothetical protein
MISTTSVAIEDHCSDGWLPVVTESSSIASMNSCARLIGIVAGDSIWARMLTLVTYKILFGGVVLWRRSGVHSDVKEATAIQRLQWRWWWCSDDGSSSSEEASSSEEKVSSEEESSRPPRSNDGGTTDMENDNDDDDDNDGSNNDDDSNDQCSDNTFD